MIFIIFCVFSITPMRFVVKNENYGKIRQKFGLKAHDKCFYGENVTHVNVEECVKGYKSISFRKKL